MGGYEGFEISCCFSKGATIRILWGPGVFFNIFFLINIFGRMIGEINKWPKSMVEINILSTEVVEKL